MSNFTFLTEDQIFGDNKIDIIKKYGEKCAVTDFAILLGGYVSSYCYTSEGKTGKDRASWWWTKTPYEYGGARVVSSYGYRLWYNVKLRNGGVRPALPYSSISSISSNVVGGVNGVEEVECGEYPQTIVDENYSRELERAYNNGRLRTTGKYYTTDSVSYRDTDTSFRARAHTKYEYNGSKYIRFVGDSDCDSEVLSDGRKICAGDIYWLRVEPVTWLVDEKEDIALIKKIIVRGIPFCYTSFYNGDFNLGGI